MSSHQKHDDMDETGRRHRRKEQHKNKKKKKRREESSSSSRSSSPGEVMRRIEEERERQKEMRRKEKEMMKALETPEEKRLRRIAKKEAKSRKMKARMGWDNDYLHYTNADNPFGDNNLLETFRWDKKLEKEGLQNVDLETLEKISRQKQEANKNELEKVKKRRQEREAERAARDDEMALLQREKEAAQFEEWENQEDQFHLKQALLRSKIRIQDGRAKPIDLLAKYISAEEEVDAVEMHEPYTYLNGLTINDLEDLIEDITVYKELEHGHNLDYWTDITIIVEDELSKLRKLDCEARAVDRRVGIHHAVATDVAKVFRGKTAEQLIALQQQIESKLENETGGIDVSYWESLLSQLKAQLARARLRDRHQENLRRKLEMLKAEQREVVKEEEEHEREMEKQPPASQPSVSDSKDSSAATSDADESEDVVENILELTLQEYEHGRFSPALLTSDDLDPGTIVTDEVDDVQRLEFARNQVTGKGVRVENVMTVEEKALHQEAKKGMLDDEAVFSVEASLGQHTYLWSDKYRPRKPRYFNRVHTGFEWNKYNQTHYDMDNPPPKIVQGYKFNIFYPDLIDKGHTPEYTLATCEDNLDFAILRFSAGPPYEDIAFKIVSREWEYSYRRGFRCQFHNNIFQLWFHFKRYRYRR